MGSTAHMGCWENTRKFCKSPPKGENNRVLYMRSPTYTTNVSHNNGESIRDRYCSSECRATLSQLERCTTSQIVAEKESKSHFNNQKAHELEDKVPWGYRAAPVALHSQGSSW